MADWRRGHLDVIPGIEMLSTCGAPLTSRVVSTERIEPNLWQLLVHSGGIADAELRIQVDGCGAWVTVTTHGDRPVVVRRAGWVELRGQRAEDPMERWDRVGLGPGDALVVSIGSSSAEQEALDALLPQHLGGVEELSLCVPAREHLIVRVPPFDPEDGVRRAQLATGLPEEAFARPLHPPGSPAAELWSRRPAPPMEGRMQLVPTVESVPLARGLLRRLVVSWRMAELLDDVLELLANEVLTNAIVHARTELVSIIRYDGTSVRFEVVDGNDELPDPQPPSDDGEGGRGLWIVDSLADRWGVDRLPVGKSVWFEVDVDGGHDHDAAVIFAHGVLRVAQGIEAGARALVEAPDLWEDEEVRRAGLRDVVARCNLVVDLLTDLVQGRVTGDDNAPAGTARLGPSEPVSGSAQSADW